MAKLSQQQTDVLATFADYLLSLSSSNEGTASKTPKPSKPKTDKFDKMDRAQLKAFIAENELEVTVVKTTEDAAIRAAIRAAVTADAAVATVENDDAPADDEAAVNETPADDGETPVGEPADVDEDAENLNTLRSTMQQLIITKGDAAATAVLAKFKVERISKIPVAKLPEAIKAARAALK
jgi:hypothetical protein